MNSNGVISFGGSFTETGHVELVCPFYTDLISVNTGTISQNSVLNTNEMNRITQLIQESFGYSFVPTGVFTATWDAVPYLGSSLVSTCTASRLDDPCMGCCYRQTPSNVY